MRLELHHWRECHNYTLQTIYSFWILLNVILNEWKAWRNVFKIKNALNIIMFNTFSLLKKVTHFEKPLNELVSQCCVRTSCILYFIHENKKRMKILTKGKKWGHGHKWDKVKTNCENIIRQTLTLSTLEWQKSCPGLFWLKTKGVKLYLWRFTPHRSSDM